LDKTTLEDTIINKEATIHIKNLRLRTIIGCNESERNNLQDIIINVKIDYNANKPAKSDNLDEALNYRTITKKIIKLVEHSKYHLLEKLGTKVLSLIMEEPLVNKAEVEIDKPQALRFTDSVSMAFRAQRSTNSANK